MGSSPIYRTRIETKQLLGFFIFLFYFLAFLMISFRKMFTHFHVIDTYFRKKIATKKDRAMPGLFQCFTMYS